MATILFACCVDAGVPPYEEILSYIVDDSVKIQTSGALITGGFAPAGGTLTLQDAADQLGFDHFNWVQIVTADPHQTFRRTAVPGIFAPLIVPYLDPPDRGYFGPQYPITDLLPFYWNEEGDVSNPIDLLNHTTTNVLDFQDRPTDPRLQPGESVEFATVLAGVYSDGTWDALYTFTWFSDHNGGVGGSYRRSSLEEPDLGVGGAVILELEFDVRLLPTAQKELLAKVGALNVIPEPSTPCLAILSLLSLSFSGRQRHIQHCRPKAI